jgi:glycosyltransferase involved in cell wall biosynthesis
VDGQLGRYRQFEPRPQFAALRAQRGFLAALSELSEVVRFIGSEPVSTWPRYGDVWISSRRQQATFGGRTVDIRTNFGLNLPAVRLLVRSLCVTVELLAWLMRGARSDRGRAPRVVVVYSLHFAHLLPAFALSMLFGAQILVIIPDLPRYMNVAVSRGRMFRFMKTLEERLALGVARLCDGQIVFTKHIAKDFALGDRWLTVETVALDDEANDVAEIPAHIESLLNSARAAGKCIALYSGGVSAAYGVPAILKAVEKMEGTFEAWVCGPGDIQGMITSDRMAGCVRNLGVLDNRVVRALQRRVDVLMNLRPAGSAFTRYSFPSKLAEYMLSGTPVVTTALEGIPHDYYPHLIVADPDDTESVVRGLTFIRDNRAEATDLGRRAVAFMLETRGVRAQARRIYGLLQK